MKNSILKNSFTHTIKFVCALGVLTLVAASCKKEDSRNLNVDTPIYQHYKVMFGADNNTSAYALFTRNKTDFMKEIQLTGDQRIQVNGDDMNFHRLNEADGVYSYTKVLGNVSDVAFTFTRAKDKVYKNAVKRSDVNAIGIPADLSEISKGKIFSWTGAVLGINEKIEATISQKSPAYRSISASLTNSNTQLVFPEAIDVPAGSYQLMISRVKTVDTKENNAPAGGYIEIVSYETKNITVK